MSIKEFRENVDSTDVIMEEREVGDFAFVLAAQKDTGVRLVKLHVLDYEDDNVTTEMAIMDPEAPSLKDGACRDELFIQLAKDYYFNRITPSSPKALAEAVASVANVAVGINSVDTSEADAVLEELIGANGTYDLRR